MQQCKRDRRRVLHRLAIVLGGCIGAFLFFAALVGIIVGTIYMMFCFTMVYLGSGAP